jgi:hypothetical protein
MKYKGHESFAIRKNWLAKGIKGISIHRDLFTSKEYDAMDILGIGRNMVYSLRYWLRAIKIAEEKRNSDTKKTEMIFTDFGNLLVKYDSYAEEMGSLWLLQYNLASNREDATSWYFFFNEFNLSEFTKEDFVTAVKNYDEMHGGQTAMSSFESDFECIINTYVARYRYLANEIDAEDNIECPLTDLGLVDIQPGSKRVYRKIIPPKQNIPSLIVLAVLVHDASDYSGNEIPLSDIQNNSCSIGKVFNLDTITLMDILSDLENSNYLHIIRTAGLDVVRLETKMTYEACIIKYYEELNR